MVSVPGKIIKTNAVEVDGNTVAWNCTLGQISKDTEMNVNFQVINEKNIILFFIFTITMTIIIGLMISKKRKME